MNGAPTGTPATTTSTRRAWIRAVRPTACAEPVAGGSWRHRIKFTRVSARSSLSPNYRYNDYGFRVYADAG